MSSLHPVLSEEILDVNYEESEDEEEKEVAPLQTATDWDSEDGPEDEDDCVADSEDEEEKEVAPLQPAAEDASLDGEPTESLKSLCEMPLAASKPPQLCGILGCILLEKHAKLCVVPHPQGRRTKRPSPDTNYEFNVGDVVQAPWGGNQLYTGVVKYIWEQDELQHKIFVHFDDCDSSDALSPSKVKLVSPGKQRDIKRKKFCFVCMTT